MNAVFILLIVLTLARLWIGLQLFLTARKSHLDNLYWLSGAFVLAVYNLFASKANSPLENPWIFNFAFMASHFCLAMFIHTTFYRGRKSPIGIILGLFVVALFGIGYYLSVNNLNMATVVAGVSLVNWIWHLFVAQSAYAAIAGDPSVEKWVKTRYKLMAVYIVLIALGSIQTILLSTSLESLIPKAIIPLNILLVIGSIVLQFLVWVMPEPFRLWLNRTQQPIRVSDGQQPRSVLDVFGSAMSTGTGLNSIACFYAIRSAIGKQIGTEDSDVIRNYIQVMTYRDWEALLQNTELRRILINGGADKVAVGEAINNARQALVEKQSLLTLSTR